MGSAHIRFQEIPVHGFHLACEMSLSSPIGFLLDGLDEKNATTLLIKCNYIKKSIFPSKNHERMTFVV